MNAQKSWGFVVMVLVSALSSGCGVVTSGTPAGVVASGVGGIVAADSAPAYRPAAIADDVHGYTQHSGVLMARHSFRR